MSQPSQLHQLRGNRVRPPVSEGTRCTLFPPYPATWPHTLSLNTSEQQIPGHQHPTAQAFLGSYVAHRIQIYAGTLRSGHR